MDQHAEHGDHGAEHEELEVFPDSGITETGKPIFAWLWVVYAVGLVFFHWFLSTQFWAQNERTPKWGPGWQAVAKADQWDYGGKPAGMATTGLLGLDANDKAVKNMEASAYLYDGAIGGQR
jgi:hypothetical protein